MDKKAQNIFETSLMIRCCENVIINEYSNDQIKMPVHLSNGEEGAVVATVLNFPDSSYYGTYRSHALFLALTQSPFEFFKEMLSKESSFSAGRAGSMHLTAPKDGLILTSAIVASTIPVAVGHSFANKYKGNSSRTVVMFGDGAMDEGVFWESLNYAVLHELNITFVLLDNGLAIHNPKENRSPYNLDQLLKAYNVNTLNVDSIDPLIQYESVNEFKSKSGVQFIRLKYYRLLQHVGVGEDFSFGYRKRPENINTVDPVLILKNHLNVKEEEIQKMEEQILTEFKRAQKEKDCSPSKRSEHVY